MSFWGKMCDSCTSWPYSIIKNDWKSILDIETNQRLFVFRQGQGKDIIWLCLLTQSKILINWYKVGFFFQISIFWFEKDSIKQLIDVLGAGLPFIVYTDVLTRFSISPLFSVLVFVMMIILGMGSEVRFEIKDT